MAITIQELQEHLPPVICRTVFTYDPTFTRIMKRQLEADIYNLRGDCNTMECGGYGTGPQCDECNEFHCAKCSSKCKCNSINCFDCGGTWCWTCGIGLCLDCSHMCTCDASFCAEHVQICHDCGSGICDDCLVTCDTCPQKLCEEQCARFCDQCERDMCRSCSDKFCHPFEDYAIWVCSFCDKSVYACSRQYVEHQFCCCDVTINACVDCMEYQVKSCETCSQPLCDECTVCNHCKMIVDDT